MVVKRHPPIFIVGVKRSGTTLLRLILNTHSEIAVTPESQFITFFYKQLRLYGDLAIDKNLTMLLKDIVSCRRYKFRNINTKVSIDIINKINPRTYSKVIDVINTKYMLDKGKFIWADKTPIFHKQIPILIDMFPDAKIIHIIRDPRACISSQMRQYNELDVYHLAYKWKNGINSFNEAQKQINKKQIYEISYEKLVVSPFNEIKNICEFIGVVFQRDMINYFKTHEDDMMSSTSDLYLKKISGERIDFWKEHLSEKDIARIEFVTKDLIKRYRYDLITDTQNFQESKKDLLLYKFTRNIKKYKKINNIKLKIIDSIFYIMSKTPINLIRRYSFLFSRMCNITESSIRK